MKQRIVYRMLCMLVPCVLLMVAGCATQIGIAASPSELYIEVDGSREVTVITVTDIGSSTPVTAPLTITSADTDVATIDGNSVVGVGEGTTELTITDGTFTTTATVNVVPAGTLPTTLVVTPTAIMCTPESADTQLQVFATLTSGTSVDITADAIYGSNDSTVALVTAEGKVVCVSPGAAQVAVQYLGLAILVNVAVQGVPPASVTFTPAELLCEIGDTPAVQISATDDQGLVTDVTGTASVSSSAMGIATFVGGAVQCLAEGTATITANVNGVVAQLPVEVVPQIVDPSQLVSIAAVPQNVVCNVTQTAPFSIVGQLGDGSTVDVSADPLISYASSDSNIVLIFNGQPVCVQAGQATVQITLGALQTAALVTVQ